MKDVAKCWTTSGQQNVGGERGVVNNTYLSQFLNLLGKDRNKENMTLSNMAYHRSLKQEPPNMSLNLDLGAKLNCQVFFSRRVCLFFFLDKRPPKMTIARGKSSQFATIFFLIPSNSRGQTTFVLPKFFLTRSSQFSSLVRKGSSWGMLCGSA